MTDARWMLLRVPFDGHATGRGEERAPASLDAAGLTSLPGVADAGALACRIRDTSRDPTTGVRALGEVADANRRLRDRVAEMLEEGRRPLVVGGCCGIVPGCLAAARRHDPDVRLAFIDGHLDIYDGDSSDSGELAGMDLALLVGHGAPELTQLAGEPPIVPSERIVAIGYRDDHWRADAGAVAPDEIAPSMRLVPAPYARALGPAACARAILDDAERADAGIWVHFDVDALDERDMPPVSFPLGDGLGWSFVEVLLGLLMRSPRTLGADITDFNADLDPTGESAMRLVTLLERVLGDEAAASDPPIPSAS